MQPMDSIEKLIVLLYLPSFFQAAFAYEFFGSLGLYAYATILVTALVLLCINYKYTLGIKRLRFRNYFLAGLLSLHIAMYYEGSISRFDSSHTDINVTSSIISVVTGILIALFLFYKNKSLWCSAKMMKYLNWFAVFILFGIPTLFLIWLLTNQPILYI